jgi:hypothetical protein
VLDLSTLYGETLKASFAAMKDWEGQSVEFLAALSTNSVHRTIARADHASFWRDPGMNKVSSAAILEVVEAARSGTALK